MNTKEFLENFCIKVEVPIEDLVNKKNDYIVVARHDIKRTGCDITILINPTHNNYEACIHFPNSEDFEDIDWLSSLNIDYSTFNIISYYTLTEEGKLLISLKDYETRR